MSRITCLNLCRRGATRKVVPYTHEVDADSRRSFANPAARMPSPPQHPGTPTRRGRLTCAEVAGGDVLVRRCAGAILQCAHACGVGKCLSNTGSTKTVGVPRTCHGTAACAYGLRLFMRRPTRTENFRKNACCALGTMAGLTYTGEIEPGRASSEFECPLPDPGLSSYPVKLVSSKQCVAHCATGKAVLRPASEKHGHMAWHCAMAVLFQEAVHVIVEVVQPQARHVSDQQAAQSSVGHRIVEDNPIQIQQQLRHPTS